MGRVSVARDLCPKDREHARDREGAKNDPLRRIYQSASKTIIRYMQDLQDRAIAAERAGAGKKNQTGEECRGLLLVYDRLIPLSEDQNVRDALIAKSNLHSTRIPHSSQC